MGRPKEITGLTLSLGTSLNDYPRSLKISASPDGNQWQEIQARAISDLYWTGKGLLQLSGEKQTYRFPLTQVRYVRLTQKGRDPVYYWSIHELEIF